MTEPGQWHTVAQGESVESVAYAAGHRWQTLWEHPSNAPLRAARRSPHVLLPGDRVFIPALEVKAVDAGTSERHRFRCESVPSRLRLRFSIDGVARADAAYVLTVDGVRTEGRTNGDGRIDVPVHPLAERAVLEFLDDPGRSARRVFMMRLRHLDPSGEMSGAHSRLRHNGYDARTDARARDALRSFQERRGLTATGELDADTQDALASSAEG